MLIFELGQGAFQCLFSDKCGEYFVYDCLKPVAPQITPDTWTTIVDALLKLIFMMGQVGYRYLFC